MFNSFEDEPLGAASLAQVHKAVLKDGRTVAVKVQHRKVKTRAAVDMATMEVSVVIERNVHSELASTVNSWSVVIYVIRCRCL